MGREDGIPARTPGQERSDLQRIPVRRIHSQPVGKLFPVREEHTACDQTEEDIEYGLTCLSRLIFFYKKICGRYPQQDLLSFNQGRFVSLFDRPGRTAQTAIQVLHCQKIPKGDRNLMTTPVNFA